MLTNTAFQHSAALLGYFKSVEKKGGRKWMTFQQYTLSKPEQNVSAVGV